MKEENTEKKESENTAAITIQNVFQSIASREKYINLLYRSFMNEKYPENSLNLPSSKDDEILKDFVKVNSSRLKRFPTKLIERSLCLPEQTNSHNFSITVSNTTTVNGKTSFDHSPLKSLGKPTGNSTCLSPSVYHNFSNKADDTASMLSDYSELAGPVQAHFFQSQVQIIDRNDLQDGKISSSVCNSLPVVTPDSAEIQQDDPNSSGIDHSEVTLTNCMMPDRQPDETEEDYQRRVRKHNLLSLALEFAEIKRTNSEVLPFGLHQWASHEDSLSGSDSEQDFLQELDDDQDHFGDESGLEDQIFSSGENDMDCSSDTATNDTESLTTNILISLSDSQQDQTQTKHHSDFQDENCIQSYRSERIRALERLAGEHWSDSSSQEQPYIIGDLISFSPEPNSRFPTEHCLSDEFPSAHMRLEQSLRHHPMIKHQPANNNRAMQMCFRNEACDQDTTTSTSSSDSDESEYEMREVKPKYHQTVQPISSDLSREDLLSKQARIQAEANFALSQVESMARMQLEVEKHSNKNMPFLRERIGLLKSGQRLQKEGLQRLSLPQLQIIVNDLHTQIELLNEDLVKQLIHRDDLHLEQGSKLIDVEDLTRRAQEIAQRLREDQAAGTRSYRGGIKCSPKTATPRKSKNNNSSFGRALMSSTANSMLAQPRRATAKIASFFGKKA